MLCQEVQNYISSVKGLPFFYIVGDESYSVVLSELKAAGLSLIRVSDFCTKEDKFPSIDDLIYFFRTSDVDYRDNKFVVVGLGEYLALKGAETAITELLRLKNTTLGNARVVLLIRGVPTQAIRIATEDTRMKEQQRVFISDKPLSNIRITNVIHGDGFVKQKGMKNLLNALEEGKSEDIVTSTMLMLNDSLFPITLLSSSFDVFNRIIPASGLKELNGTESFWASLLNDLKSANNDIDSVFEKYGIDDAITDDIYSSLTSTEYKNWLVFLYLLLKKEYIHNNYLRQVLDKTDHVEDLKSNILNHIINYTHKDPAFSQLYSERKKIVKCFPEEEVASFIRANDIDPNESIYRLTDNTEIERKTTVRWIATHGMSDAIQYVYPDLNDYLGKYIFSGTPIDNLLTEYFDEYKKQKVLNHINPSFLQKVKDNAESLSYAKLQTRNNAIMNITNKNDAFLYWIDALGVEYLSYFVALAHKRGLSISISIARSDLPTITEINKQFFEQWSGAKKYKEDELDNIKHKEKGGYFFTNDETPIHIVSELKIIEKAIGTAATELAMHRCKSFVIASDHGASRLAVINKQEIPYDTDTKGEHSGRCCKFFEGCDVPYKIPENGYIVLSDYGRFRKSRAANVEVHGGASLEEIVVPIITLTLKKQVGIVVKVLNPNEIIADRKTGVKLTLYISDVNSNTQISIVCEDTKYIGKQLDDSHYVFEIENIKRAKTKPYKADVFDGSDLVGSIEFKVKGKTATMNEDFDFGSDF